jgi:hypothetical protein
MQAKHAFADASDSLPSKSLTPRQNDEDNADSEAARAAVTLGLRQAIRTMRGCWRNCDQRVCKRARRCCASQVFCAAYDLQRAVSAAASKARSNHKKS